MNEETIGSRIKRLRDQKGMTQGDLMRAARQYIPEDKILSRATISRIENEQHVPTSWTLDAIASALGVRTDYLLSRTAHDTTPQPAPEVAPFVERLNRLEGDKRELVLRIIDGILTLAGQPAAELARAEREAVDVQRSIRNLYGLAAKVGTSPDLEEELTRLRAQLVAVESRRRTLSSRPALVDATPEELAATLEELRTRLECGDLYQKRELLRRLIAKLTYGPDGLIISYHPPV